MSRAPYNVLVLPYRMTSSVRQYCIFLRRNMGVWQFIAGGGEDAELPLDAARREAFEEASIPQDNDYFELVSSTHVPAFYFSKEARAAWGEDVYVIPVHCFATNATGAEITISHEHAEFRWVDYEQAAELLHFDIDKTALWELESRLQRGGIK